MRTIWFLLLVGCASATVDEAPSPIHAEVVAADSAGTPTFIRGELADMTEAGAMARISAALGLSTTIELEQVATRTDARGGEHRVFSPRIGGIPVIGGDVMVHVSAAGIAYAASRALPLDAMSGTPVVAARDLRVAGARGGAELVYVVTSRERQLHLAWMVETEGVERGIPVRDRVFVDAETGAEIDRHGLVHSILARRIHDAAHGTVLPGALARSEGAALHADASVNAVYDNVGAAHACLGTLFGRDGIDGGALVASVHYGNAVANAFWDGTQMAFGDGDGVDFADLATSFDVVAHELTHGITQKTAGLVYANEPGALNEAFSDIMAVRCAAFRAHEVITPETWMLADDVFTPATSGDALRYLADPAADGSSSDFYRDRYVGSGDHGGVHLNSGIPNLAFVLLAQGGTHPRAKSTTVVPALGIDAAGRIFYRAFTTYLTSSSGFEAARIATAQAALDLYGADAALAVEAAWTAVGVEEGMTAVTTLANGIPITLSHDSGATRTYAITVPPGSANLRFELGGGTGNADLYVRYGAPPTADTFDHAPRTPGNAEVVTPPATAGTWYLRVRTLTGYAGATLRASFEKLPIGTALANGTPIVITGAQGSVQHFYVTFPPKATDMTVRISGGTGDADLYARYGAGNPVTTAVYDKHQHFGDSNEMFGVVVGDPPSGTWQVMVHGMRAYANVSLVASWVPDPGTATLVSGVPTAALSGSTGSRKMFAIEVPPNAVNLRFELAAPTQYPWESPADIFVKRNAEPTLTSYDGHASVQYSKAQYTPTWIDLPGTWFVMVRGKTSYANVTLVATYDLPPPPQPLGNGATVGPLSGSSGALLRYTLDVPAGATNLVITTSGGTGDADLYVKRGTAPTTTSYDKRSATYGNAESVIIPTPVAGTYHVLVRGYSTFNGVALRGSYTLLVE
jgi:vibriolysin